MKKMLVICLALALIASMGCSSKPQNEEESTSAQKVSKDKVSSTDRTPPAEPPHPPKLLPSAIIMPTDLTSIRSMKA